VLKGSAEIVKNNDMISEIWDGELVYKNALVVWRDSP